MNIFETPSVTNDNLNVEYDNKTPKTGWVCPKCGKVISPDLNSCPYCSTLENNDNNNEQMICE